MDMPLSQIRCHDNSFQREHDSTSRCLIMAVFSDSTIPALRAVSQYISRNFDGFTCIEAPQIKIIFFFLEFHHSIKMPVCMYVCMYVMYVCMYLGVSSDGTVSLIMFIFGI
jgi:hypothetical protein